MYNSLSKPRKLRVFGYIRVASMEQFLSKKSSIQNNKVSQTMRNKSHAILKQFLEIKRDYQSLSNVHRLIKKD